MPSAEDDPLVARDDREAILEILRATKQDLPDEWRTMPRAPAPRGSRPV